MGLFNVFRKKAAKRLDYAPALRGGLPIYTIYDQRVYASDAVQSAIQCIVNEMRKLAPQHVRRGADEQDWTSIYDSSVQKTLDNPNVLMTTNEFIEKTIWELYKRFNAFIIPTFITYPTSTGGEARRYTGLYPVSPTQVEFEQSTDGDLYIKFRFANNFETTLLYDDVIHLRLRFSDSDYMGGNEFGLPDNTALKETLKINDEILRGLSVAMQSSGNINGIVRFNTILTKDLAAAAMDEFNTALRENVSGFLPLDMKAEVTPFKRDVKLIDADTIKFIDEKILRYFGVPLSILTGNYTAAQYEAFYDKTLEPLVIMLSQAFTKTMFTPRERSTGNRIIFQPGEMVFMTNQEKLNMVRLLGDAGSLFENEKRRAFGLAAIPELEGVRMMSLNYVDSEYARQYQTGIKGGSKNDGDGNKEI